MTCYPFHISESWCTIACTNLVLIAQKFQIVFFLATLTIIPFHSEHTDTPKHTPNILHPTEAWNRKPAQKSWEGGPWTRRVLRIIRDNFVLACTVDVFIAERNGWRGQRTADRPGKGLRLVTDTPSHISTSRGEDGSDWSRWSFRAWEAGKAWAAAGEQVLLCEHLYPGYG